MLEINQCRWLLLLKKSNTKGINSHICIKGLVHKNVNFGVASDVADLPYLSYLPL